MSLIVPALLVTLLQGAPVTNPGVRTIAQDEMSQADSPRQSVARTAAEWEKIWRAHAGDAKAPAVDFSKEMVAAIFLGTRPSAGFSIQIVRAIQKDHVMTLQWSERRPGRDMVTAQVLTSPVMFAAVPKFAGEIKFEKVEP
jgi:hypothetical protein